MFKNACWDGLKARFNDMRKAGTFNAEVEKTYTERLAMEIDVISTMGFPAYFLIVADFITWAKKQAYSGRPRPRVRCRKSCRLLHAHHQYRSHPLRPYL